jgi:hypothetical protein
MARTIKGGFADLSANLEITTIQKSTASTRQQTVREAMEKGFTVLDSFLAGSYARSTMTAPLSESDIDIFVIIDAGYWATYNDAPAAMLESTRKVLLQSYPTTPKIKPDGQAVTVTFADFIVDVVPAFNRRGGGYLIPNTAGGWIQTNPTAHAEVLTAQNKWHGGNLVPLVKMIKGWNRSSGGSCSGFYLELMTTDILNSVTISDFSSGVRFVLDKGREKIKYKQRDPAGLGDGWINGLKKGTVEQAVARFARAYELAVQAEALASTDRMADAVDRWRSIFGDYFPAYG